MLIKNLQSQGEEAVKQEFITTQLLKIPLPEMKLTCSRLQRQLI